VLVMTHSVPVAHLPTNACGVSHLRPSVLATTEEPLPSVQSRVTRSDIAEPIEDSRELA